MEHATAITNCAFDALLHQAVHKIITVPTEKAVPSVFTSRHDLTITGNKITLITFLMIQNKVPFQFQGSRYVKLQREIIANY